MKHLTTLFFACLCSSVLGQQSAGSTRLPPLQSKRVVRNHIKHISLKLHFDWQRRQAAGTATITCVPLKPTNRIYLDGARLTIHSVIKEGKALKFEYDGSEKDDALVVLLPRMYRAGEQLTFTIDYHTNHVNEIDPANLSGTVGQGLRFSTRSSNDPHRPKEVYSVGEYQGNRYWFPCYDSPNDWRTSEITVTVEKGLTVVSNGVMVDSARQKGDSMTFHYRQNVPYPNHLTSIAIGPYVNVSSALAQASGKILMANSYGYANEVPETAASVVRLTDMMNYLSRKTGIPYPFASYSQVFVQSLPNWVGGNTVSTITENMVDDAETHADFFYLWDLTEAEALASQWFGNYVAPADWADIWLNRALSRYFNFLYCEYKNGKDELLSYLLSYDHGLYLYDWQNGYRHPIVTNRYQDVSTFTTDNYTYGHGAEVLHMLRKHLGEQKFFAAIRLYLKTHSHQPVSTRNFVDAVNSVSGQNMNWFFDQWVYRIGHPVFMVTQDYDTTKNLLIIRVQQAQERDTITAYSQQRFFQGKLDIAIDGNVRTVWVKAQEWNTYHFPLSQKPRLVNFDVESTWIKEVNFDKPLDELLYQVASDRDILGRYWAVNEITRLIEANKIDPVDKQKIKATYEKVLGSEVYWRFKAFLLSALSKLMPRNQNNAIEPDENTRQVILSLIKNEKSWLKASAISFLGNTRDSLYVPLYLKELADSSFRVVNSAAAALGKTKSSKALPTLLSLAHRPSMKSQSLLCSFSGLIELGDTLGYPLAYHSLANPDMRRWRLPNGAIWDYRVWAVTTIASLKMEAKAYLLIKERLLQSIQENDDEGVFNNALLVATLGDARGKELFDLLKSKYKNESAKLAAVTLYEEQLLNALKNR